MTTHCDECGEETNRALVTARNAHDPLEGNIEICCQCADNLGIGWFTANAACNVCLYSWQAVFPAGTDTNFLECPRCTAQSSFVAADF